MKHLGNKGYQEVVVMNYIMVVLLCCPVVAVLGYVFR